MSDGLWSFAIHFYGQPGVASTCLELQDRHGVDVPLMLFALWAGLVRGRRLEPPSLALCSDAVKAWHVQVVRRLREVRRVLADPTVIGGVAGTEPFRSSVKAIELQSERLEIEHLERLIDDIKADKEAPGSELALHNLRLLLRSQAGPPIEDETASVAVWAGIIASWHGQPRASGAA